MEGFVHHEETFEVDLLRDRELVEVLEDREQCCPGVDEQASSRVLDILEFFEYCG